MNDLEETLDLLVESVSVDWSVSEDEGAVEERLQLNCCVVVRPGSEGVLGPFTGRYREGWVTLMPLHGDHARTQRQGPACRRRPVPTR